VPWANGLGVTADVSTWPPDRPDWTWRLSIADVSNDLPFSHMPGIDRHIMVAQGAGMALTIAGAAEVRMDLTTPPLTFDGAANTTCRLLDGPIADLNLMVRRAAAIGELRCVRAAAHHDLRFGSNDVAVVVLAGTLTLRGGTLVGPFDALLADGGVLDEARTLTPAVVAIATVVAV